MDKKFNKIFEKIIDEYEKAKEKFPAWTNDPIHAAGILNEEAGEVMKATLKFTYEDDSLEEIEKELYQTGAMVIRSLLNLNDYKRIKQKDLYD